MHRLATILYVTDDRRNSVPIAQVRDRQYGSAKTRISLLHFLSQAFALLDGLCLEGSGLVIITGDSLASCFLM